MLIGKPAVGDKPVHIVADPVAANLDPAVVAVGGLGSAVGFGGRVVAVAPDFVVHVENRLHWVLDVMFHEGLSRLRSGAGPQDMAIVRHMAMNLLRQPKDKHSLKARRKSAAWDTAYLEALLHQSA